MRSNALIKALLFVASASAASTSTCNADNCARAVTGTQRMMTASHFADCKSFLSCTVTPSPVTVTSTALVGSGVNLATVTAGSFPENRRRDVSPPQDPPAPTAVTNCPSAVPTYASACSGSARYSSACSCYGATRATTTVATPTVTVITTVFTPTGVSTVTVAPPLPTLCSNSGLQWGYFYDSAAVPDVPQESVWDPTTHKHDTPSNTGLTNYLHYSSYEGDVYGTDGLSTVYFELEHRGYIFAPETGAYTFNVSNVDNIFYAWIGSAAYSGWTAANSNLAVFYDPSTQTGIGSTTQTLLAGTYYPFRVVYKNGFGPGLFDLVVTAPSGYVVVGNSAATAQSTPFLVQYSCDGILAPQYPPFGQES